VAVLPADNGILLWNGVASFINEAAGLSVFINGTYLILSNTPLPAKTFVRLSYQWSEVDIDTMRITLYVQGVFAGSGEYPKQAPAPTGFCWLAGDSSFTVPFLGCFHLFSYNDIVAGSWNRFLIDDNQSSLANSGTGAATAAIVDDASGSAWEPATGVLP